jgi:hypothetical protein
VTAYRDAPPQPERSAEDDERQKRAEKQAALKEERRQIAEDANWLAWIGRGYGPILRPRMFSPPGIRYDRVELPNGRTLHFVRYDKTDCPTCGKSATRAQACSEIERVTVRPGVSCPLDSSHMHLWCGNQSGEDYCTCRWVSGA